MRTTIFPMLCLVLLTACTDTPAEWSAQEIGRDSELCRRAVADQLSRERASFSMRSDMQIIAYDQRYHFCMVEKGHPPPPSGTERVVMSAY